MQPPGADTVLVRHGDLNTKSRQVQGAMERRLVANLQALLADRGVDAEVERRWSRPLIHTSERQIEDALDAATSAPGVVSASAVRAVPAERQAIETTLAEAAREHYHEGAFAVRGRRADKSVPFDSEDAQRFGGTAIWEAVEDEFEPEVDLDDPDLEFFVEIRDGEAFVFLEKVPGPGGLPLGTQDPVVALISGGIDSPVAAFEVMRRGSPIVPVYLDLGDYGGVDHRERAVDSVRTLASYAPNHPFDLRIVDADETVDLLADRFEAGRMLAFRRYMYRVAERVAEETGAVGIVTGEAIGQKSSQTTSNLGVTSSATTLPIHRPLLTVDKQELIERAKDVGTYSTATIPAGCNRFAPDQAETHGDLASIEAREPDDLFERAERDADAAEVVGLGRGANGI
ncbi:thiamine biosynthesis protein ThiI [Natronoarchaeum philippinense]|uniref:Probable tRNA sulfurtransferase n=1 Tax=Natronoarchaeum philippinense TaxID=558529 RepID=A0A285N2V8_NATPI|nr:tRNA sulfurtransferase [Natronoarchaeum philippinense]SNZ03805.1 thiamine biosynthesis protein ThiI [Natronoarchaeum philippinense]